MCILAILRFFVPLGKDFMDNNGHLFDAEKCMKFVSKPVQLFDIYSR